MNNCEMPYENSEITNYSPLYDSLKIYPEKKVTQYESRISYNKYSFIDISGIKRECFKKYITLVDYVKFLIGKYKSEDINQLPCLEQNKENDFQKYIHDINNYAYVDGFFYYLTSKLKQSGFVHGIEFYDSYICVSKNCQINIADDFEYLCDSNFFNEKLNNLFHFKDHNFGSMFQKNKNDPVSISEETVPIEADELSDCDIDIEINIDNEIVADETYNSSNFNSPSSEKSYDSDHSTVDNSSEGTEEWNTDEDEDEDDSDPELEELTLIIHKIPTQVVAIELCESTFDSILESDKITMEELESAMFQIIVMLYVYQNVFKFTHNDLHTNNIMYVSTKETFLYYKIGEKHFKIPTFGKIYKIIDFGRSIYTVNNQLLCSDSFSSNGTAHTQYNFGPFFNKNKPIIEPNYSFDLCRLACSMVDFIVDDDFKNIQNYRQVPVYDMIISWLYDDNNINVLYKKNGEERYPDFKLYKMIARIVHNHTPERQFSHPCFTKYEILNLNNSTRLVMDLNYIMMLYNEIN